MSDQHGSATDSIDFSQLTLRTRPLCQAAIYVDAERTPGDLGVSPFGQQQAHYIRDGWFAGARLTGRVLPGGGDWPRVATDGTNALNVRAVWRTEEGALIYVTYQGRIWLPPDAIADVIAAGGDASSLDPSRYYFRIAPTFETAHPAYQWLNRVQAIGVGRAIPGGVAYAIEEVL
jgi:hypothetical protein